MTKRYMDFAPVKNKASGKTGVSQGRATAMKPVTKPAKPAQMAKPVARTTTGPAQRQVARPVQRPAARPAARTTSAARPANRPVARPAARPVARPVAQRPATRPATQRIATSNTGLAMRKSSVKLGEIEDVNPKFVKTDVPKRPLNDGTEAPKPKETATVAKSKRIGGRLKFRSAKNASKKSAPEQESQEKVAPAKTEAKTASYKVPATPFINQDKVAKRPLSKNVYAAPKKGAGVTSPVVADKKTGKTTTIIDKPEKDSRMGMVVAIILTIILGAVAGTVAFLLLPK